MITDVTIGPEEMAEHENGEFSEMHNHTFQFVTEGKFVPSSCEDF